MKKSGLIAGFVSFLFALGAAAIISPICVPCLALVFGLLAGYLAGAFDKPGDQSRATKAGTLAGLAGGIGMLLGQILASVINSLVVGPEGAARMLVRLGIPAGGPAQIAEIYWPAMVIGTACMVVFDVALMSGFGTLGGLLWWKLSGNKPGSIAGTV